MARRTAKDFSPEVLRLFDLYVHGLLSRRGVLDAAAKFAAAGASAAALLDALQPRFAEARQVAENDPRVVAAYVSFPAPEGSGEGRGYFVEPAGLKRRAPAILVVHENRGLNPHIEDVARRLALEGFLAFAPDALAPLGGYPGDEDRARELFQKLDQTKARADFVAAVAWLMALPQGNGRVGVIGFCWGGGTANALATKIPDLSAVASFYGPQPPAAEAAKIKAPLMLHYAGEDERIDAGWPAFEAALKGAGVPYQAFVYPGVQHGFNNDTTPRYDEAAAKLAWGRTIAFFKERLG